MCGKLPTLPEHAFYPSVIWMPSWDSNSGGLESNRRRSQRVMLSVAITVRSDAADAFEEQTQTLIVNAHGALIALGAKVKNGQTLWIKNQSTHEEQACKVVFLGQPSEVKTQVGIEFTARCPGFWRIAFPPEDWNVPERSPAIPTKK
jgi:hypothetical protein